MKTRVALAVTIFAVGLALFLLFAASAVGYSASPNYTWLQDERNILEKGQSQEITLSPTVPVCTYYLGFNTAKTPFTSTLVRKAFIAAIDRIQVSNFLSNTTLPAMTFTPPGVFGHVDGFQEGVGIPYNLAQARQWLADAGYPNGQGLPDIDVVGPYRPTDQMTMTRSLEFVQWRWHDDLNARVTMTVMEASAYQELLQQNPPQIWYLHWCADQPDQQEAYYYLHDGIEPYRVAFGNWQNTTYNSLLAQAMGTPDPEARKLLYKQAEEILVETDAVMLPMHYYHYYLSPMRPRAFLPMIKSSSILPLAEPTSWNGSQAQMWGDTWCSAAIVRLFPRRAFTGP